MSTVPVRPIRSEDVPWTEWSDVPRFGLRYRHLSLATMGEAYHVGVAIEELSPGMQSVPAHYHFLEEEHVFILEGSLTLRLGDGRHSMKAGDYACFPAGQKAGHCLINEGTLPCRYVIIGEQNPNEVAVQTDSKKVLVRSLGRRMLYDIAATRGYWHGEATGLPAGQTVAGHDATPGLEPAAAPFPPVDSASVRWDDTPEIGSTFGGRCQHLTRAVVGDDFDYHVGVAIESPEPGKRLFPKHFHMLEEEQVLILEGELTLLLGDERIVMGPGDFVAFPAGQEVGHSFLNSGSGPCRYLIIGERNPNDVCVYPDSNKIAVSALGHRGGIYDLGGARKYWDGEGEA